MGTRPTSYVHISTESYLLENDLDGEALAAAVGQGPESLKEVLPSLSKRLKLIGAIKVLTTSFSTTLSNDSNQVYDCDLFVYKPKA